MNRSRRRSRALIVAAPALSLLWVAGCHSGSNAGAPTQSTSRTAANSTLGAPASAAANSSEGGPASSPPQSASASADASQSLAPSTASASASPSFATFSPTATYALPAVVAAFAGKDITHLPTTQHVIALTFDAGANADAVPEILATLHDENVPGTFFLTGAWVRRYPAQTAQIAQHYPVGSHSDTHPYFTKLTNAQLQSQLDNARQAITAATGHDPRPLFRFPFGDRDTRTRDFVNSQGYVSVFWTVDTLGWEGTSGGQSVASVVARVTSHLGPGEIVLMHVGSHPTDHSTLDGDALRTVIDDLKAAGYGFVTVPQGLGLAR